MNFLPSLRTCFSRNAILLLSGLASGALYAGDLMLNNWLLTKDGEGKPYIRVRSQNNEASLMFACGAETGSCDATLAMKIFSCEVGTEYTYELSINSDRIGDESFKCTENDAEGWAWFNWQGQPNEPVAGYIGKSYSVMFSIPKKDGSHKVIYFDTRSAGKAIDWLTATARRGGNTTDAAEQRNASTPQQAATPLEPQFSDDELVNISIAANSSPACQKFKTRIRNSISGRSPNNVDDYLAPCGDFIIYLIKASPSAKRYAQQFTAEQFLVLSNNMRTKTQESVTDKSGTLSARIDLAVMTSKVALTAEAFSRYLAGN